MAARSTLTDTESKTKMIGLTDASINPYIYHCCKCCASKRQMKAHLPQDIAFNVLLHLPAHVLHDVMRHVCREWSLVLRTRNFVFDHLRNSTGGLISQNRLLLNDVIFVEMRRGRLEIHNFDCGFQDQIWSSCNGLVLAFNKRDRRILYVTNPVTKQWLILPPYPHGVESDSKCALAFVEASMEYKVVFVRGIGTLYTMMRIVVLTIGVDKVWRHIDVEPRSWSAFEFGPIVTGGFIHWVGNGFVLTFNVETETIRHFLYPDLIALTRFLPMGSNLSFISAARGFFSDVRVMNPETGEWTMLPSIDLETQSCLFDLFSKHVPRMIPSGWLVPWEVLVFNVHCSGIPSIAYNLETREIQSFELEDTHAIPFFRPHVNSLVWLGDGLKEMEGYQLLTHCPPDVQRRRRRVS